MQKILFLHIDFLIFKTTSNDFELAFSQTKHKNRRPLNNSQNSAHAPPDLWKVCKNLTKNSIWIWKDILKVKTAILNTYLFIVMYQGLKQNDWLREWFTHCSLTLNKWFSVVFSLKYLDEWQKLNQNHVLLSNFCTQLILFTLSVKIGTVILKTTAVCQNLAKQL